MDSNIRKGVAGQAGGLLWDTDDTPDNTDPDEDNGDDGAVGVLVPA